MKTLNKGGYYISHVTSKGQTTIPRAIRAFLGLKEGSEIAIGFDWRQNLMVLLFDNGQDGVAESIEACGASGPGATPGPGPLKLKPVGEVKL